MKKRTHEFVISLTFNKACPSTVAINAARNNIHGKHFIGSLEDDSPEIMKVKAINHLPQLPVTGRAALAQGGEE